jgi:regulator of replication initiation timing
MTQKLFDECRKLQIENQKLRAALEVIAHIDDDRYYAGTEEEVASRLRSAVLTAESALQQKP